MTSEPHRRAPGIAAAAVVGVLALAGLSTLLIATANGGFDRRNHAYATVSCSAPTLSGAVVTVSLGDMGGLNGGGPMMGGGPTMVSLRTDTSSVAAGSISFVARNQGNLVHEMLILPLSQDGPGTRPVGTNGKIDESSSLGEVSRSCGVGAGNGLAPGATGWVTIHLAAGRYELLCDQPWHYADGMFDVITVQ